MDLIAKGAEATLLLEDGKLVKHRSAKGYRIKELDLRLRKLRTQREAKLLETAKRAGIPVPRLLKVDMRENRIHMEYLDGPSLKDVFEDYPEDRVKEIAAKIGETIAKMHDVNVVHNDLTSSNMIYHSGVVCLIDFGLGAISTRIEDKAMDLVVLKKSLNVAHTGRFHIIWKAVMDSYCGAGGKKDLLARMATIEKRARYSGGD
jgi:Kae1-associated kinase Bud32